MPKSTELKKVLDTAKNLAEILDRKSPTKKEVADAIISVINELRASKKELRDEFDKKITTLEKLVSKVKAQKGEKGDKGDKGESGKDGVNGKDGLDGLDGKDADQETTAILVYDEVEKNLPRFGEQIRDALELLEGEERLDKSAIKGLEEELKRLSLVKGGISGGIVGRDIVKDIDISDDLDGVTKTFNIPTVWNIISVHLSSFPHALRKTTDFTYTPTSITFTSEIDAAKSLKTGDTCVLTVVTG